MWGIGIANRLRIDGSSKDQPLSRSAVFKTLVGWCFFWGRDVSFLVLQVLYILCIIYIYIYIYTSDIIIYIYTLYIGDDQHRRTLNPVLNQIVFLVLTAPLGSSAFSDESHIKMPEATETKSTDFES